MQVTGQSGVANGEWPHWGGDLGSTKYSPLDQINRDNVKNLRIAWRWKSENFGPRPQNNMEGTPLMVGGVLYTTAGVRPNVVAIDARHRGNAVDLSPRRRSARRSRAAQRVARRRILDRRQTGAHHPGDARVPARLARREDRYCPIPRSAGTASSTCIRISISLRRRTASSARPHRPSSSGTWSSSARPWSAARRRVRRKTPRATFAASTCARASVCGRSTPFRSRASSATTRGRTTRGRTPATRSVWSPFSADEELGYVYLPVESATGDFYGGHRPGNNLFAGSLVCLDARTGKRVWHHQLVHHDIWDYDLASPPTLINITVGGKPIRAVAQMTKWGYLFAFDRVNGTPVWPIEERPVEAGTCRASGMRRRSRTRRSPRPTIARA